ncbi:hypothetical protein BDF21DRAFT_425212 [Thamnidium elegans]|nr:hypothetical protein BDF21DRAFT_425212 [Thamnidium elegans]
MDYMYNHFKNLKESFKDFQAYASGYDPHQYGGHANDSDFKFHYNPTTKTWNITKLVSRKERMKALASNIADNVTHTFAYGAFAVASYICPKKTSSSSDYDNDAFGAEILSRSTYIDEERPLDDSWGLVDYYYLSVEFTNTNPPPKLPRKVMKLRK